MFDPKPEFPQASAERIYREALEVRGMFGSFTEAVKAVAGCEAGVLSAPRPGRATAKKMESVTIVYILGKPFTAPLRRRSNTDAMGR